jgi:hypothetical protein
MVYMIAQNVRPLAKCEEIGLMPLGRMYFKVAALHTARVEDWCATAVTAVVNTFSVGKMSFWLLLQDALQLKGNFRSAFMHIYCSSSAARLHSQQLLRIFQLKKWAIDYRYELHYYYKFISGCPHCGIGECRCATGITESPDG